MQDKANQISAATVEILDEASVVLASTPAAPREAAACQPVTREAAAREAAAADATDSALAAWTQHLASKLVDYCAVDLRVRVRRVVRLGTAYPDPAQPGGLQQ